MRNLTRSEAAVVGSWLASPQESEAQRIRQTGIPRRTYQEIHQRALAEGWVQERLVPHAASFGAPVVTFALARPPVERMESTARRWAAELGATSLWSSPESIFGVFFAPQAVDINGDHRGEFVLTVDARAPTVPVYFDFEGIWVNSTPGARTSGYPKPLPGTESLTYGREHGSTTPRFLPQTELDTLWAPGSAQTPGTGVPRWARRFLRDGRLLPRIFPDLRKVPPPPEHPWGPLAFLTGELPRGSRPEVLFGNLLRKGSYPFLFATDARQVLVGIEFSEGAIDSVKGSLENIALTRMRLDELQVQVSHDYRRVVSPPR